MTDPWLTLFTASTSHPEIPNGLPTSLEVNAARVKLAWMAVVQSLGPCWLTSGYRGIGLNEAIGGSGSSKKPGTKPSAHMDARAVDFVPRTRGLVDAMVLLQPRLVAMGIDKLIIEGVGGKKWLHLQVPREGIPRGLCYMTLDGVRFDLFNPGDRRLEAFA